MGPLSSQKEKPKFDKLSQNVLRNNCRICVDPCPILISDNYEHNAVNVQHQHVPLVELNYTMIIPWLYHDSVSAISLRNVTSQEIRDNPLIRILKSHLDNCLKHAPPYSNVGRRQFQILHARLRLKCSLNYKQAFSIDGPLWAGLLTTITIFC